MNKYIITPMGILEKNDLDGIMEAIDFVREHTENSELTERFVLDDEETGKFLVQHDNRAICPTECILDSAHDDEDDAFWECDRINNSISDRIHCDFLKTKFAMPSSWTALEMGKIVMGEFPQSRKCEIFFQRSGQKAISTWAHWDASSAQDMSENAFAIRNAIVEKFPQAE